MQKKPGELKRGDVLHINHWSNLWKRIAPTTCTVMDVTEFDGNFNIMVRVKDGLAEFVTDLFATADTEYTLA